MIDKKAELRATALQQQLQQNRAAARTMLLDLTRLMQSKQVAVTTTGADR